MECQVRCPCTVWRGTYCNIPQRDEYPIADSSIVRLENWLDSQETGKLKGDRLDKPQLLVDEGKLGWVVDRHGDDRWNAKYNSLLQYGVEHGGDFHIPADDEYPLAVGSVVNLGTRLVSQRQLKAAGNLRENRQNELQQLVVGGNLD